ncbi:MULTISPECIES: efflux transporter outer membrane subunit [unclassified Polynucleobacter]|uniref:efflux transporter outer membrane subunit n=1 Tax=unclassified Polynucleobacter TaxID=2640945 RepID=UPI001F190F6E|nr:efflux transporter outer membrane subunit [Polynucleobacter sp. IMCC 30228]MCE7529710.1 efflux transporter outer membrane subunit [Polynucleobacter sp. IMCC 29146]
MNILFSPPSIGPHNQVRYLARLLLAVSLLGILAACAVGPDFKQPDAPKVGTLTEKPLPAKLATTPDVPGGSEQTLVESKDIPAKWWELFKSPELDVLIRKALEQNPNLAAADAALRAAKENVSAQIGGQYFPKIGGNASATREQLPYAVYGLPRGDPIYDLYNTTVNISYVPDFFGRARRTVENARAQAEISQYQLEGAYLNLTSNLVTAAVREAQLRAQYQATKEILEAQTYFANIIKQQLEIGSVSKVDLTSQLALVASSQAELLVYEKNVAFARNQLAALTGEFPGSAVIKGFNLSDLHLPDQLPLSLPSSLVRQRPDILAAESVMKSTNALVGVATANLLPQITLSGAEGSAALTTGALFGPTAALWSIAGGLFQPLFQGGQLLAQRRGAMANYEQAVFQYQAAVITAFQQVADALQALDADAKALTAATDTERYAKETLNLVQHQYRLGTASYLQVLYYQTQYQNAKIRSLQAQALRFSDTAALFTALGGGWWNREGPAYQAKTIASSESALGASVEGTPTATSAASPLTSAELPIANANLIVK